MGIYCLRSLGHSRPRTSVLRYQKSENRHNRRSPLPTFAKRTFGKQLHSHPVQKGTWRQPMGDVVEGHAEGVAHMGASSRHPDQSARSRVRDAPGSLGRLVVLVRQRSSARLLGPTSGAPTNHVEPIVVRASPESPTSLPTAPKVTRDPHPADRFQSDLLQLPRHRPGTKA